MSCFNRGFVIATRGDVGMYVDFATEYGVENDVIEQLVIGSAGPEPELDEKEARQKTPEFMKLDGLAPKHLMLKPVDQDDAGAVLLRPVDGEVNIEGIGLVQPGKDITILPGTTFRAGPWTMRYQLDPPQM